jgi:phthiocerol/phenolphthiocerol synthesis type-I polyketide synthase E
VYLITGGLGGIGSTFARWMAQTASARLILTSRQPLPPRDQWDEWLTSHFAADPTSMRIALVRELEASGAEVIVLSGDVADASSLAADLRAVRDRWGDLHGIVHSAGIADDALLALYERDNVEKTVSAKVAGTEALIAAVGDVPLDFALFCSSINAAVGNAGSAAYTAGNAYLDLLVESSGVPAQWNALSVAWGAWRDVGMTTRERGVTAERKAHVAAGITPADGIEAFVRAKAAGANRCVVWPFDLVGVQRLRQQARRAGSAGGGVPVRASAREGVPITRPDSSQMAAPEGAIEQRLAEVWQDLLGISPIGVHDNFFELGGHSLMATRVIARIEQSHGVRLPLREIFNAPTIRQLAALVATAAGSTVPSSADNGAGEREEFEL